jgi:predicted component of viral defense system (DUF524 family)
VIDSPIKSEYVLAQISQNFWIYVGTKQAGKSVELDKLFSEAKRESRPALLACNSKEALLFGPGINEGRILYAGASKADFLCRLRFLENTDYHWELFGASKRGPTVIAEDKLPTVTSSLRNTRRISTRWEIDTRQAKGVFNFGNFLGSGWIGIINGPQLRFEVISAKLSYEEQYLALLRDLTDQSVSLLFDPDAPTQGKLIETEGEQRRPLETFLLLQASLPLDELKAAMGMIKARPHSQLESDDRWLPAGMANGMHAMGDPIGRIRWGMNSAGKPVPIEALERKRRDTTDTAPNRFIKHAIGQFTEDCRVIMNDPEFGPRLTKLASELHAEYVQQSRLEVIKTSGRQGRIPLENQVLQKRDGYRHYLRSWVIANKTLSIKDINDDGALSPTAENRQVPDLYEYWLFFFLADALEGMTGASSLDRRYVKELNPEGSASITLSKSDAPRLTLRIGKGDAARFVALYYNRTFKPGPGYTSYSLTLRPDYTVETFPFIYGSGFEQCRSSAGKLGEITYIHFDAKFRIANLDLNLAGDFDRQDAVTADDDAKPEDVYKMHTYNEAIRGTAASVILFPGGQAADGRLNQSFEKYRELIPGVGALAISPGNHEVRSKALTAVRAYLSGALLLAPKGQSAYAQMRDREAKELPERKAQG